MADGTRSTHHDTLPPHTEAARNRLEARAATGRAGLQENVHAAVLRARAYIESHLGEQLTLQDLSRVACMSRFHLARRFRHGTGTSPMQYLHQLRIQQAKHLLRLSGRSLSQIAVELGFFDQSHFTRCFRRATGTTPGAYARQQAMSGSMHATRGPCSGHDVHETPTATTGTSP